MPMEKYPGAPSWVKEHLEGLDHIAEQRRIEALEKEWPGIGQVFDDMIDMLPHPDNPNKSEFPFSAAVIRKTPEGKIEVVAMQTNQVNATRDSTNHAEAFVLRQAEALLGSKHLDGCALLSTVQPCMMCSGAIIHTEIKKVVYGATQADLRGKHVRFPDRRGEDVKFPEHTYKPHRPTPAGIDTDSALQEAGVDVFAGYKRKKVLNRMRRLSGSFFEYYQDPDT